MNVLITGGNGFVAGYVARELLEHGHVPTLSDLSFSKTDIDCTMLTADITVPEQVQSLIEQARPDACIHLGGITSVVTGNKDPLAMFNVNISGTATLLEAFRLQKPDIRFLFVSTGHVYGTGPADEILTESAPLKPRNLYAASKAAADIMTLAYAETFGMDTMTARPNNHVGPGQSATFVLGALSTQVKAISRGETDPILKTGNLESTRDFTDVRDVAIAYRLLLELGKTGASYNIGSARQEKIGDVLALICKAEGISPEIQTDPELMRPSDHSPLLDTTRIREDAQWQPSIPLETTINDIMAAL